MLASVGGGANNTATLSVTMVDPGQRKLTQGQFSTVIRNELNQYPGMRAAVQDLSQQGFGASKGYPLEFSVRGSDWDTLVSVAMKLKAELAASGLATDVDSDYQVGSPELTITPDRDRASDVGVQVSDIATTVSALVGGEVIGQYSTGGRRINMNVRVTAPQRSRPESLELMRVRGANNALIPLSSVVVTAQKAELLSINHADRERAITITGNIAAGHAQGEALAYVQSLQGSMPQGYHVVMSGASSAFSDAMRSLVFALLVGILVAYMVLASQFNSFLDPITVLTILPLSVAGAMFALLIAGRDAQRVQHDRFATPDGYREEELDHPGRLRARFGSTRGRRKGGDAESGADSPSPDPHDSRGHADGRGPVGARHRPGQGDTRADGRRGYRRIVAFHGAEPARGACVLRGGRRG